MGQVCIAVWPQHYCRSGIVAPVVLVLVSMETSVRSARCSQNQKMNDVLGLTMQLLWYARINAVPGGFLALLEVPKMVAG